MPAYDYLCKKCGKRFTTVHSMTEHDKARVACPKCNSRKVERVLAAFFAKTSKKS